MSQTSNLLEKANTFHAYIGRYESKGVDYKRRITIPKDIVDLINLRREMFDMKETVLYGFESTDNGLTYLSIWDYLQAKELAHLGDKLDRDGRNRITIPKIFETRDKRDLVWIGKGDHFELHYNNNS